MNKTITTNLTYNSISSVAEDLALKVENTTRSYSVLKDQLERHELEQQRLQQLLIDNEARQLETTNEIYQSIKSLSEICKNTEKQLLSYIQDLEYKTAKKIKRLIFSILGLGAIDLILITIQIISYFR